MNTENRDLSIEQVAQRAGLPVRTVRFYVAKGLLPGPGGRGKAAAYGEEHLLRLRLIRLLTARRVPLDEIRERLAGLAPQDIRALLVEEEREAGDLHRAAAALSPKEYVAALLRRAQEPRPAVSEEPAAPWPVPAPHSPAPPPAPATPSLPAPPPAPFPGPSPAGETWRRWELAPGVELHVRADAEDGQQGLIVRLLAALSR